MDKKSTFTVSTSVICLILVAVLLAAGCSTTSPASGGSPLVTVAATTSPVPQAETIRVDESDKMIVYSPGWKNEKNAQASGGTWALTGYGSYGYDNIKMTLAFNGTGISLVCLAAPFGGIADVTVDGKAYPSIDMYSNSADMKTVPIATGLSSGTHTVVLSPAKNSNSAVVLPQDGPTMPLITIDAFDITRLK